MSVKIFSFSALVLVLGLSGCVALTPDLVKELAKDDATFCANIDVRGGAGSIAGVPTGGYGQSTAVFCRSKMEDAQIETKPDGSMSIRHGKGVTQDKPAPVQ